MSQPTDLRKLLIEARDDVADLLERMKSEGWHRVERIASQEKLLADIDAALAEKVEPVAWVEVIDSYEGPYNFHGKELLPVGKHHLYAAPQSDDRAGMLRDEVMSLYDAEIAKGGSADFERADQNALAAFDPRTKVCTMNCGPTVGDPRSQEERRFLCPDCVTVPVPSRNRANDLFSALLEFHNAFCNRDETTSLHVWNERMKSADENAVAVLNAAPPSDQPADAVVVPSDFHCAVKRLVIAARTSGGTAGRDDGLCKALDAVEAMLRAAHGGEMNTQAEKKDPVDLVKAESKYGGYVTKENPVVSAQFAIKLAIQIDELNNQLAKFKENGGVYRTRIINAIHMLDAGHTKKQVRLHLSIIHDETMMEAK